MHDVSYLAWIYHLQGGLVGVCGGDIPRQTSAVDYCDVDDGDDPPLDVQLEEAEQIGPNHPTIVLRTDDDVWVAWIDAGPAYWESIGAATKVVRTGKPLATAALT